MAIVDEAALMDRVDGDLEFLEETIDMLDADLPELLERVRLAAAAGEPDPLAKAAHALKGMLANFCADSAVAAALELEVMGREARLEDAEAASARLARETEQLQRALREFLASRTV